jgi:ribosomal-protein-alanine N-acetyltransferase
MNDPANDPGSFRIRRMTMADVPAVYALDVQSFSLPWPERSYRYEVSENPNAIPLVSVDETGRIVGMAVTWVIIDEAHVATIAVGADWRRRGLGRELLVESLRQAHARGARLAYLEVRKGNSAAIGMYRHFGFNGVGERPRYYQDNHEDALLMTLDPLDCERLNRLERLFAKETSQPAGGMGGIQTGTE